MRLLPWSALWRRRISVLAKDERALLNQERQVMETDVLIVGAGPAGLSAAIKLKQLRPNMSVMVLEKASEIGSLNEDYHIGVTGRWAYTKWARI